MAGCLFIHVRENLIIFILILAGKSDEAFIILFIYSQEWDSICESIRKSIVVNTSIDNTDNTQQKYFSISVALRIVTFYPYI